MPERIKNDYQVIGTRRNVYSSNDSTVSSLIEVRDDHLTSSGHYLWQDPPRIGNVGGAFFSTQIGRKRSLSPYIYAHEYPASVAIPELRRVGYEGRFIANSFPPAVSTIPYDATSWGPVAFDRMKPAKPSVQSLNAIFELKDLPGMLKQRFEPNLKGVGDYHLATQFGWLPLWRDIKAMVETQRNLQRILNQLIRDNGRPVRRRVSVFSDSTSSVTDLTPSTALVFPAVSASNFAKTPTGRRYYGETVRIWASARFRYWLPAGPRDIAWRRKMIARIFGFQLTPSVVYNAVPWSWLADWFTNAGNVISNMDAGVADRLAADYVYLMCEKRRDYRDEILCVINEYPNQNPVAFDLSSTQFFVQKQRILGDPFGFSTIEANLNGMQLSILGALGLSRLR